MFTRTDSGLYRPRTIEEDRELETAILSAPLLEADYVSSISQILSPRRGKELISLAKIIRDAAEPQVRTTIPNDLAVRPYRKADSHPHLQAGLKVELMYSYLLLHAGEQDSGKRAEYLQEAQRLEKEVTNSLNDKNLFIQAGTMYNLRSATIFYFRAAWNFLNNGDPSITKANTNVALQWYDNIEKFLVGMQSTRAREFMEVIGKYWAAGTPEVVESFPQLLARAGIKADHGGIDELVTMLITDQFAGLRQDALFGKMRCYALLGNKKKFIRTSRELADYVHVQKNNPAPVITKSCVVMMDDYKKNLRWKGLKLNPFVSDSPAIVLRAVEDIEESLGKVSSKLWKPGGRLKPLVELP